MARVTTRLRVHLKRVEDKENMIKEVKSVQAQIQELSKEVTSDKFLQALNTQTEKLYLRDLDKDVRNRIIVLVTQLKQDYNALPGLIGLTNPEDLSRNYHHINEVFDILQITDNVLTHLKQSSIPRVARLLRDEINTMRNILKELGVRRVRVVEEDIKESESKPTEQDLAKVEEDIKASFGWNTED